jgi:hypothetical protein
MLMQNKLTLCGLCVFLLSIASPAQSQSWEAAANMHESRSEARAIVLSDGRVLVAGGRNSSGPLSSCEIYDPVANKWSYTSPLNERRFRFELRKLPDGQLFVAGGLSTIAGATLSSCEIYDPSTERWTLTASMSHPREIFGMLVLPDSTVLVQAGVDANSGTVLSDCEAYDPKSEKFKKYPDILTPHYAMNLFWSDAYGGIISRGGQIGGGGGPSLNEFEILRLHASSWEFGNPSTDAHSTPDEGAAQFSDERILVPTGRQGSGTVTSVIELFDPFAHVWRQLDLARIPHDLAEVVALDGDTALVVGGSGDPGRYQKVLQHCFYIDPVSGKNWDGPPLEIARFRQQVRVVRIPVDGCSHSEEVLAIGGEDSVGNALSSCERLILGVRQNPPQVELTLKIIDVTSEACAGVPPIGIRVHGCGQIFLDSILCADTTITVSTPTGHLPLVMGANLNSISLTFGGGVDSSTTSLKFIFGTQAGLVTRYVQLNHGKFSRGTSSVQMLSQPLRHASLAASIAYPLRIRLSVVPSDSLLAITKSVDFSLTFDPIALQVASVLPPSGWLVQAQSVGNGLLTVGLVRANNKTKTLDSLGVVVFNVLDVSKKNTTLELRSLEVVDSSSTIGFCPYESEGSSWVILLDSLVAGVPMNRQVFTVSQIYPNPTPGDLRFEVTTSKIAHASVVLYDLLGREATLSEQSIDLHAGKNAVSLSTSEIPNGVYLLRFDCAGIVSTREVRIVR